MSATIPLRFTFMAKACSAVKPINQKALYIGLFEITWGFLTLVIEVVGYDIEIGVYPLLPPKFILVSVMDSFKFVLGATDIVPIEMGIKNRMV